MSGPMRIRAAASDGVTEVRILMSHPMETGQRRDTAGELVPAHYITELTATHNDRTVLLSHMGPSVSANPYLAFKFKGGNSGDTVKIHWVDNKGESRTDEVQIR